MRQNLAIRRRVGKRVKQLRLLRQLSQEQLAELIDRTPKHVGQIERGEVNVGIDSLTAIAEALSVDVGELVGLPTASARRYDILTDDDVALVDKTLQLLQRLTHLKV